MQHIIQLPWMIRRQVGSIVVVVVVGYCTTIESRRSADS
jgi:hypothetical protein